MKAKLSLMGLYEYDSTIFDDLVLPDALTRSDVINNLLLQTASFSVVFPDPNFMKGAIGMWSRIHLANWEWLYNTQHYEYNPIWNVDVKDSTWHNNLETRDLAGTNYETRNLAGTNYETRNLAGTENETLNLTQTENGSRTLTNNGSDTVNNYVAAFNDTSETLTHRDKSVTDYGRGESETTQNTTTNTGTDNTSTTDTGTVNHDTTDTGTDHFDSTDTGTVNNEATTEFYKRGNQGVTTTQQMIREEQELAKKNLIEYITNEFKKEFCLLVYA